MNLSSSRWRGGSDRRGWRGWRVGWLRPPCSFLKAGPSNSSITLCLLCHPDPRAPTVSFQIQLWLSLIAPLNSASLLKQKISVLITQGWKRIHFCVSKCAFVWCPKCVIWASFPHSSFCTLISFLFSLSFVYSFIPLSFQSLSLDFFSFPSPFPDF